ncbi:MAG: hypothetical protein FJY09_05005 [Chlorobi bacterium]|nr:hypothetical protein [Chlorobiota bacterium]
MKEKIGTESASGSSLPFSGKLTAIAIGAVLISLTSTVPYLTLLNAFFLSGVFIAGMAAIYYAVIRYQVRLSYSEAFLLGSYSGLAGGMLSEAVSYLLVVLTGYRPGTESLTLLLDWARGMAAGKPELAEQMRVLAEMEALALAPVQLTPADLLTGMFLAAMFYAPVAGLGGIFMVFRLKRKAAKSRKTS